MQALQSAVIPPTVLRAERAPMVRSNTEARVVTLRPVPDAEGPVFTVHQPILPGGGLTALVATAFLAR